MKKKRKKNRGPTPPKKSLREDGLKAGSDGKLVAVNRYGRKQIQRLAKAITARHRVLMVREDIAREQEQPAIDAEVENARRKEELDQMIEAAREHQADSGAPNESSSKESGD